MKILFATFFFLIGPYACAGQPMDEVLNIVCKNKKFDCSTNASSKELIASGEKCLNPATFTLSCIGHQLISIEIKPNTTSIDGGLSFSLQTLSKISIDKSNKKIIIPIIQPKYSTQNRPAQFGISVDSKTNEANASASVQLKLKSKTIGKDATFTVYMTGRLLLSGDGTNLIGVDSASSKQILVKIK